MDVGVSLGTFMTICPLLCGAPSGAKLQDPRADYEEARERLVTGPANVRPPCEWAPTQLWLEANAPSAAAPACLCFNGV